LYSENDEVKSPNLESIHIQLHRYTLYSTFSTSAATVRIDLYAEDPLVAILKQVHGIVQKRCATCKDLTALIDEIKQIVRNVQSVNDSNAKAPSAFDSSLKGSSEFYTRLIHEIDNLGWHTVQNIDADLCRIQFKFVERRSTDVMHVAESVLDKKENFVLLTITLPLDYPKSAPKIFADLPMPLDFRWKAEPQPVSTDRSIDYERTVCGSLVDIYNLFKRTVEALHDYIAVLDDWDQNCWILEPPSLPCYASAIRRVAIGPAISLQLEHNSVSPHKIPSIRLMGNETLGAPIRAALQQGLHLWDEKLTPRMNLINILGPLCPMLATKSPNSLEPNSVNYESVDLGVECAICYTYRLEQETPDIACENEKCHRVFHCSCLSEWLRSLPTSRTSFGTIFGACPQCQEPISTTSSV
jgi:E3 ubiquitin-protein ligase FANCL